MGRACLLSIALILAACLSFAAALNYSSACPSQCRCTWQTKVVQCQDPGQEFNVFIKQVPLWTGALSVFCAQSSSQGSPALWSPRPDAFRSLLDVREISVLNCPLTELPDELFAYLPLLNTVTLSALRFVTLPPRLFRDSPSLAALLVANTPTYARQAGSPLTGTAVSDLRLVGTGLDGASLLSLISPIAGRLRSLSVVSRVADSPLRLPPGAFNNTSSLDELNLANNRLANFHFLDGISAVRVTLSYNPIDSPGLLSFASLRPNYRPTLLEFNHVGLHHFPLGLAAAFPALKELLLANNAIEVLPADQLLALNQLTRLDLSSNQIRQLSSELKPALTGLLYRDRHLGHVYLANNPLHCNCELAWIFDNSVLHNNLPKDIVCASGGSLAGQLLIRVQRHQLLCSPATKPAIQVRVALPPELKSPTSANTLIFMPIGNMSSADSDEQQYLLPAGSTAELTCTSSGDPAPSLRWLWLQDLLKSAEPPRPQLWPIDIQRRQENRLVLHVDQAQMLSRRMLLTCLATSAGTIGQVNSTVTLISQVPVVSSTASPPPQPPQPGEHQQTNQGNSAGSSLLSGTGMLCPLPCQLVSLTVALLHQL